MSRNPGYPETNLAQLKEVSSTSDERTIKQVYQITVVTPMFGGGYEPGRVDENRPIRESAVRGQLRFWWRATRGAAFTNACDLRKREAEIFGDTSRPSNVRVSVKLQSNTVPVSYNPKGNNVPSYLFQNSGNNERTYIANCTFDLCLQWTAEAEAFNTLKLDIEAALWAWINFGGIGARTRRGCGSLYCKDFSPSKNNCTPSEFSKWLDCCIAKYSLELPPAENPREWPTLNPNMLLAFKENKNIYNWKNVIGKYKDFRRRAPQKICYDKAKGKTYKKAGRSYWPEADSIRSILNMAHPRHDKPTHFYRTNSKKQVIAFPRAELGMPIIFRYRDPDDSQKYRSEQLLKKCPKEPPKTQLTPVGKERLASPLILKSLAFSENHGVGLIAVLNHSPIKMLTLKVVEEEKQYNFTVNGDSLDYINSPMKDEKGHVYHSAIDAFLKSTEVKEFCKINNPVNI